MPGFCLKTPFAPLLRSASTLVPATPVTMITLPLPLSFWTRNCASCWPNLTWSVLTLSAHGSVTMLSNDTTRILRWHACRTTPLRPVGEAALMTIASTCSEIRFEICCVCLLTSLPELNTWQSTWALYGGIAHAALNVLTISMRHLFPMNEFESAILSFLPLVPAVPAPPPPLSLPPPHATTAVASTTTSPATRIQRPVLRTPAPPPSLHGCGEGTRPWRRARMC